MTDKDFTWLAIVQDRSGSIALCLADQQGGLNTFIDEQRKQPGRCVVSYTQFDTQFDIVFEGRPIEEVEPIVIEPRGGTALLDAIGYTITRIGEQLRALPEALRPASVVFLVNTDGEENSSRRFHYEQIAAMVKEQTERWHWLFVFLSAGQDAIAQARNLGMNVNSSMGYNVANTRASYGAAGQSIAAFRSSTAAGADFLVATEKAAFTDEQREEAAKTE